MRNRKEIQLDLWANDEERRGKKASATQSKKIVVGKGKPLPPNESTSLMRKRVVSASVAAGLCHALPEEILASSLNKKSTSEMYFNFLMFGRYGYIGARVGCHIKPAAVP